MAQKHSKSPWVFLRNRLRKRRRNDLSAEEKAQKEQAISIYREFDYYVPDVVRWEAQEYHVDKSLPSEPPGGITYKFCATGYITQGRNPDYCVIPTEWRDPENYCHWTFSELPLICLALESSAPNIVIADALLVGELPFQTRWWKVLRKHYSNKRIIRLSKCRQGLDGILPVNHDTSSNTTPIGKTSYKIYHHSRATPYCIDLLNRLKSHFLTDKKCIAERIYINRKTRRLNNESEVQSTLIQHGFTIVSLEDLTLDEQIQLFASAKQVIGFHGAGLTNLIYCSNETSVIEIVDPDFVYPSYIDGVVVSGKKAPKTYYHVLCTMKGLRYAVLECREYVLNIHELELALKHIDKL